MKRTRAVKFSKPSKPKNRAASEEPVNPAMNDADPVTNADPAFLNLPTELKLQIVGHLELQDVLSVRRMSVDWAASGSQALFPNGFSVRPHLDDMDRLKAVCEHEEIAKSIKKITFFAGDMAVVQLREAINRDEYLKAAQSRKAHKVVDKIVHDLAVTKKHCNKATLLEVFPKLPNLRSLTITSEKFPFGDVDVPMDETWMEMLDGCDEFDATHCFDSNLSRKRYTDILSAAIEAGVKAETLTLDSLPIDCLREIEQIPGHKHDESCEGHPNASINLTKDQKHALKCVKELKLGFIGAGDATYKSKRLGRKLGEFVGAFEDVRDLDLSWNVVEDVRRDFEEAWMTALYKNKFPHLERLRLKELEGKDSAVLPFLFRHASTLKCLSLSEDCPYPDGDRSVKDILTDIREKLNLEKFDYVNPAGIELYKSDWEPTAFHGGAEKILKDSKLLEFYVTKKCPWPMADNNPRARGWKRKFMANDLSFLDLSEAERDDLMGDDWETDEADDDEEEEDEDDDDDMDDDDEDWGDSDDEYYHHHYHHHMPVNMMGPLGAMFQAIVNGQMAGNEGDWEDVDNEMPPLISGDAEDTDEMPDLVPLDDEEMKDLPDLVPGDTDDADEIPDLVEM